MSQPISNSLASPSKLFLFAALTIGAIALITPSRRQMAELQADSFLPEEAEGVLRHSAELDPRDPLKQRQLADVLEAQGKVDEASVIFRQLVILRPHNRSYRERLVRALNWSHQPLLALREREAMLDQKVGGEPSAEDWALLLRDYEWLQSYEDQERVLAKLKSTSYFDGERLPEKISHLWRAFASKEAEAAYAEAAGKKSASTAKLEEAARLLYRGNYDEKNFSQATRYALLSIGVQPELAASAWDSSAPAFNSLSDSTVRNDRNLVIELLWIYIDAKRGAETFPIFSRLESAGLLNRELQHVRAQTWLDLKKFPEARSALRAWATAPESESLSSVEWRKLADEFLRAEDSATSVAILQALLKGENPSTKLRERKIDAAKIWNFFFPQAFAAEVNRQRDKDRVRTYESLVRTYDSTGKPEMALKSLQEMDEEISSGRLRVNGKKRRENAEELALRLSWELRSAEALAVLERFPASELSGKGKALRAMMLDELGRTSQAGALAATITVPERDKLSKEYRSRISDLDARALAEKRSSGVEALSPVNEVSYYDFSELGVWNDTKSYAAISLQGLSTSSLHSPGMSLLAVSRLSPQVARLASVDLRNYPDAGKKSARVFLGGEWRKAPGESTKRMELGYRFAANGVRPQARASWSGSWVGLAFGSLHFDLAEPLDSTEPLVREGISETHLGFYGERRLNGWSELTLSVTGRLTHIGQAIARGKGLEIAARAPMGPRSAFWRVGPWAAFNRWGSKNENAQDTLLSTLLERRSSTVGAFASFRIGPASPEHWRARITGGPGVDLSSRKNGANSGLSSGFVEASAERIYRSGWGTRLDYSFYTGQLRQGNGSSTHQAAVSIYREF